jgi:hypothetical protein
MSNQFQLHNASIKALAALNAVRKLRPVESAVIYHAEILVDVMRLSFYTYYANPANKYYDWSIDREELQENIKKTGECFLTLFASDQIDPALTLLCELNLLRIQDNLITFVVD